MIYILFFLSGFSALVYEITWSRKLSLIFGTDAYAVSTVISVFFSGLALGSWLISKKKLQNPLKTYAALELGIGIFALFSPLIFELLKLVQSGFWKFFVPSFGTFNFFTFLLSLIALIIPTTLMGATLPVIIAATDKKRAGLLYGINTLGGFLGVVITGFFLIAFIGVNQSVFLTSVINLIIALLAFQLSKKSNSVHNPPFKTSEINIPENKIQKLILISYFLSGLSALGL